MSQYDIALKPNKSFIVSMEVNGGTTDYNKLRNKPTINGVEVVGELTSEDLNIKIPDVSGFATKEELLEKADKSEIPDVRDFATKEELLRKADKSEIPTKTSQLENDSGFITELPSLEGYALKTDIPTKRRSCFIVTNSNNMITCLISLFWRNTHINTSSIN